MNDLESKLAARLGQAIRTHRRRLQLSQAELAEALDASVEYVSLLERGERLPSLGTLVRLAGALDVPTGTLLGDTGAAHTDTDPALALLKQLPKGSRPAVIGMLRSMVAEYRRNRPKRR